MQNKDHKIATEIHKLITSIHRNANEQFINEIKTYSSRVLSSTMHKTYLQDPSTLKEKIIAKVERTYDTRNVLQCQQACHRFINSQTVSKKAEVLKMLLKLSESNQQSTQNFQAILNENLNSKKHVPNLNQTQASFNTTAMNQTSIKPTFLNEQLNMVRYRGSVEQGISESNLLKEVVFCLQNISSDLILTDKNGFSALRPDINVNDTVKRIVRELSEIGWLYKKITQKFNEEGAVTKALNLFIREEMSEYYRWLAIIENMIKNQQLTLRKLILWSYEPFQKLKWIAIILEAVRPFDGCQIISVINSYRPQGSNSINELLTRLLGHLLQPLFQYIHNWVYRGELFDPNNEFFITVNKQKNQIDWCDDWNDKFFLKQYNIPNVLDYEAALLIFNAGKTLYFLKNHCNCDYKLDVEFPDPVSALGNKLHESTSILSPIFRNWLNVVSNKLNRLLVKVMFEQFSLKEHLNSMKMFFLTGKGDFIQSLMEYLKDQLSRPHHCIDRSTLDGFIHEDAIKESFPKNVVESKRFAYLASEKISYSQVSGDGWDVFNFTYEVRDPIKTVLAPSVLKNYQRIFNFLWKVKRIEQGLKASWISSVKDYPHEAKLSILHECNLIRHQMTHFLNNLYGYLMISIESAWNGFSEKIKEAESFDQILLTHEKLQKQLLQITLSTPKSKNAYDYLNRIFIVMTTFTNMQQRLADTFSDFHEEYRVYVNRKNLIKKGLAYDEQLEAPIFNCEGLQKEVKQARDNFEGESRRFYDLIKKDSESRINSLCFRLDFSGFYTQSEYKV